MHFPHWKCVLCCRAQCPRIDPSSPESYQHNSNVIPTIHFNVYQHIVSCNVHVRHLFNEKKQWQFCEDYIYEIFTEKLYTRKELVMMESITVDFHRDFYMTEIPKIEFHLPNVRILGTHHYVNTRQETFKLCQSFQYVL